MASVKTPAKPKGVEEIDKSTPEKDEEKGAERNEDFLINLWSTLKRLTVQVSHTFKVLVRPTWDSYPQPPYHVVDAPTTRPHDQCVCYCVKVLFPLYLYSAIT